MTYAKHADPSLIGCFKRHSDALHYRNISERSSRNLFVNKLSSFEQHFFLDFFAIFSKISENKNLPSKSGIIRNIAKVSRNNSVTNFVRMSDHTEVVSKSNTISYSEIGSTVNFSNVPCIPRYERYGDEYFREDVDCDIVYCAKIMSATFNFKTNKGQHIPVKLQVFVHDESDETNSDIASFTFTLDVNNLIKVNTIEIHMNGEELLWNLSTKICSVRFDDLKPDSDPYVYKLKPGRSGVKWTSREKRSRNGPLRNGHISLTKNYVEENTKWFSGQICLSIDTSEFTNMIDNLTNFICPLRPPPNVPTDFKIKVFTENDGYEELRTFDFHKSVLCKVSDEFNNMLNNSWSKEAKNNELKLTDVNASTIKMIQELFYKDGILKVACEFDENMLVFADKYNIKPIYEGCVIMLLHNLNGLCEMENIIQVYEAANLVNASKLIKHSITCINYILQGTRLQSEALVCGFCCDSINCNFNRQDYGHISIHKQPTKHSPEKYTVRYGYLNSKNLFLCLPRN